MKKIYFVLIILTFCGKLYSQSFTVSKIDKSAFPDITASFYSFDTNGNIYDYSNPDRLHISENGTARVITNITCDDNPVLRLFSSVFVVDVSNSMNDISDGKSNLQKAKDFATSWIDKIPANGSDCAITSFDQNNYLNQDFTTNKTLLKNALNSLTSQGGTVYNQGLLFPPYGALTMTKNAKYQRIIIFLTDGASDEFDHDQIVKEALAQNAKIFCIVLGDPALPTLRDLAEKTGGICYDRVHNNAKIDEIINIIFAISTGLKPCTVTWKSEFPCSPLTVNVNFANEEISADYTYTLDDREIPGISFEPNFVNFYEVLPPDSKDTIITARAIIADINVSKIISENPRFKITPDSFNLKLGDSIKLTLNYTPDNLSYQFNKFTFQNNICDKTFFASAIVNDTNDTKLRVIRPNGGEYFAIGSDTLISWDGAIDDKPVKLDYSTDAGSSWINITDSASGKSYRWKPVPNTPSDSCLVKLTQTQQGSSQTQFGIGEPFDAKYNPANTLFAISSSGGVRIFDANTKKMIRKFGDTKDNNFSSVMDWSPDGTKIVNAGSNGRLEVFNLLTGDSVCYFDELSNWHLKVKWNPVYNYIATIIDNVGILVINTDDKSKLWIRSDAADVYNARDFAWSPDGKQIAVVREDTIIKILSVPSNSVNKVYRSISGFVNSIDWSPNGNFLATGTGKGIIDIWDYQQSKNINRMTYNSAILKIQWYNNTLIGFGLNNQRLIVTDAFTAGSDIVISAPGNIRSIDWNNSGNQLLSACGNYTVDIFSIDQQNITNKFGGCNNFYINMEWSPDNTTIATNYSSMRESIQIWNSENEQLLQTIKDSTGSCLLLGWDKTGTYIFSLLEDQNKIKIWDKTSGYLVTKYDLPGHFLSQSYNMETSRIAVGDSVNLVVYDAWTGKFIQSIPYVSNQNVNFLQIYDWSKDGKYVLAGDLYNNLIVFDLTQNTVLVSAVNPVPQPLSYCFSKDGSNILVGTNSSSSGIWVLNTTDLTIKSYVPTHQQTSFKYAAFLNNANDRIAYGKFTKFSDVTYEMINYPNLNDKIYFSENTGTNKYQSVPIKAKFSPDDSKLALALGDHSIKVLNFSGQISSTAVSNSLWHIILPSYNDLSEIDMGNDYVNSAKDTIIQGFIKNSGKVNLQIDSITINGGDFDMFSIEKFTYPLTINVGDSLGAEFTFSPSSIGFKESTVTVYAGSVIKSCKIKGVGVISDLRSNTDLIDFGKVYLKLKHDTLISMFLNNLSDKPIHIDNFIFGGNDPQDFSIYGGSIDTSFILNSGKTSEVKFTFKPTGAGNKESDLSIIFGGNNSSINVKLIGEGIKYIKDKLILSAGTASANPDQIITIPIILQNADSLNLTDLTSIETDLIYNPTILLPVDHQNISNDATIGKIHLIYKDLNQNIEEHLLENLKFHTALGNDSISGLKFTNIDLINEDIPLDTINGLFNLQGICRDGGGRFVKISDTQAGIQSINPNPSDGFINLDLSLLENELTEIYIVNYLGEKVKDVFTGVPNLGTQTLKIDINNLNSGVYIVILKTPGIFESKMFIKN